MLIIVPLLIVILSRFVDGVQQILLNLPYASHMLCKLDCDLILN
jgi:hypothetical protein